MLTRLSSRHLAWLAVHRVRDLRVRLRGRERAHHQYGRLGPATRAGRRGRRVRVDQPPDRRVARGRRHRVGRHGAGGRELPRRLRRRPATSAGGSSPAARSPCWSWASLTTGRVGAWHRRPAARACCASRRPRRRRSSLTGCRADGQPSSSAPEALRGHGLAGAERLREQADPQLLDQPADLARRPPGCLLARPPAISWTSRMRTRSRSGSAAT